MGPVSLESSKHSIDGQTTPAILWKHGNISEFRKIHFNTAQVSCMCVCVRLNFVCLQTIMELVHPQKAVRWSLNRVGRGWSVPWPPSDGSVAAVRALTRHTGGPPPHFSRTARWAGGCSRSSSRRASTARSKCRRAPRSRSSTPRSTLRRSRISSSSPAPPPRPPRSHPHPSHL